MLHYRFSLSVILTFILSLIISINTQAQTETTVTKVVETQVIETPVPAAKEVVVIPHGYVKCFTTKARWHHHVWIPKHRVCEYKNPPQKVLYEGVAWVEGYWACSKHKRGVCTRWKWKKGHWVKTLDEY